MSVQHLFKFQKEADYKTAKRNHLLVPNISKIVETGETYINSAFIPKELAEAGDIVVYHEEEDGTKTVKFMKAQAYNWRDGYWKADAIVVVPYSHTGDGTVRVMGLNYASLKTPNEGGNGEEIMFGNITTDNGIKRYNSFITFSSIEGQTSENTIGNNDDGILPSDAINGTQNPFDIETYYDTISVNGKILPSPYNNDETKCDAYQAKGDFSEFVNTPFTDMDGEGNTKNIIRMLDETNIEQTLYAGTIENNPNVNPSVIACVRYGSILKPCTFNQSNSLEENLKTMPWYLPSAGEMGYYITRKSRLNYALKQIGKSLPLNVQKIATSTVKANESLNVNILTNGKTGYFNINENAFVIPFCKM